MFALPFPVLKMFVVDPILNVGKLTPSPRNE
jgi:hypothetical protein